VFGSMSARSQRAGRLAIIVVMGLLAAGCATSKPNAYQLDPQAVAPKPSATTAQYLQISPASGTSGASTGGGITVSARQGAKITNVAVKSSGDAVTGSLNSAGTSWQSTWALDTGQSYTVTATGTDDSGHPITASSSFRTATPAKSFSTMIFEGSGATYGVGMPIMLTFSHPITNKAAVERALQVTTSTPVVGAWYWDGSKAVNFRPRDYWPAHTTVTLTAHLNGVDGGGGYTGTHTLTQTFNIGQSVIAVASTATHKTQIYIGGKLTYTWPISTGRETMPTPDGTYLTEEKANPVRMIGGAKGTPSYYNELVNWAVRFTNSGDFYHSAPWSVVSQGVSNVSHGCVNLAPADAQTFYNLAVPGNPVTITGSPKAGQWDDGFTEWFLSWKSYLKGSATGMAVEAGPHGSTFVAASSLPSDPGSVPTSTSPFGNFLAG
jgi:lipoprotein-anchoring transpeptidase ErfK/SrfK